MVTWVRTGAQGDAGRPTPVFPSLCRYIAPIMPDTAPIEAPIETPIEPRERIEGLDVIRGLALLGILLLNILAFGLPFRAYLDPSVDGSVAGIDFGVFVAVELVFEGAMRALFSMLFGAGIALLATGGQAANTGTYYRRQLLLLGIGLLDAFVLLWTNDVLVSYALAGMVLYACRNWRPRKLCIAATVVFAYLAMFYALVFFLLSTMPDEAEAIEERIAAGVEVSDDERLVAEIWAELRPSFDPPRHILEREALKFEGSYPEAFVANAGEMGEVYLQALPLVFFWDAVACMLLGMALFRTGVIQGRRSTHFYALLATAGFVVGLTVNGFELLMKIGSEYAMRWVSGVSTFTYDIGRVSMALGFASVTLIACQRGWFARLRRGLAAVGRMALTNYILQSVFGLVIFHDFGFGLWNELARHQLYFIVAGEWIFSIWFSTWWLRRFRFGPLEWLWRSLTYKHSQPMRLPQP